MIGWLIFALLCLVLVGAFEFQGMLMRKRWRRDLAPLAAVLGEDSRSVRVSRRRMRASVSGQYRGHAAATELGYKPETGIDEFTSFDRWLFTVRIEIGRHAIAWVAASEKPRVVDSAEGSLWHITSDPPELAARLEAAGLTQLLRRTWPDAHCAYESATGVICYYRRTPRRRQFLLTRGWWLPTADEFRILLDLLINVAALTQQVSSI